MLFLEVSCVPFLVVIIMYKAIFGKDMRKQRKKSASLHHDQGLLLALTKV